MGHWSSMPASISNLRAAALAAALAAGPYATPAAAQAFERSCQAMVAQARIHVRFEDVALARDNTRSVQELKNLSRQSHSAYHQVFGLTQAQAGTRYQLRASMLVHADGRVCAVPSLEVTISVTGLTVYLARELVGECRRAIVDEHELEHVAVWRNHLRAGARLLEPVLRERLQEPFVFASREQAQTGLRSRVDDLLGPLLRQLQDGIVEANRQIDSPQSYAATARRIDACP
jgi:hypothetical protein